MDREPVINPDSEIEEDKVKIPWHFWLLVGLVGAYLAFRFIQIIIKLVT